MIIDNPSISGSISFVGGTNTISATTVNLTGSLTGTFEGSFSTTANANISGAFDSVSSSLASRIASNEGSVDSLNQASSSYALAANISGSFVSTSSSLAQRIASQESYSSSYAPNLHTITTTGATTSNTVNVGGINVLSGLDTPAYISTSPDTANLFLGDSSKGYAGYLSVDGTANITGDLTIGGTVTAQEFHTEFVSASIIYQSGSTKFGDTPDDIHEFTGSLNISGSINYSTPTFFVKGTSTDGADNQAFFIGAGGAGSDTRGAYIWGRGNEATNGGRLQLNAGNTSTGDIMLYTGGSIRMMVSSSGNIGIGTTAPTSKLHVQTGTTDEVTDFTVSTAGAVTIARNHALAPSIATNFGSGTANLNFTSNSTLATKISTSTSYFNGGNVGIGTTSPSTQLHIYGTGSTRGLRINATATNEYAEIQLAADSREYRIGVGGSAADAGYTNSWYVYDNNATAARILVNSSGQVGIGTTSPGYKLDVNGEGRFRSNGASRVLYLLQDGTNSGNIIQFQDQNGSNVWELVGRNNQFYIYNAALGAMSMLINPVNSYVGIGTTSPGEKLDVRGNIIAIGQSDTTPLILDSTNSTYATRLRYKVGGTDYWSFDARGSGEGYDFKMFRYNGGWDSVMTLDWANGYVGIQTDTPGYTLDVNGSFGATSITETSALRFKKNIVPLESQLDNIIKLNPVTFDWKEDDKHDIGFIAEEVEQIIPDLVSYVDDEVQGLHYTKFTAVLVKAIQEQQKQIEELRKEISILKESK